MSIVTIFWRGAPGSVEARLDGEGEEFRLFFAFLSFFSLPSRRYLASYHPAIQRDGAQ